MSADYGMVFILQPQTQISTGCFGLRDAIEEGAFTDAGLMKNLLGCGYVNCAPQAHGHWV